MKLHVTKFVHEPPGLSVTPETDYEAALLSRYWETARLSIGMASSELSSADGRSYGIRFAMEEDVGVIVEKTRAWMNAARAKGGKPVRKPKLSLAQVAHARKLIDSGKSRQHVAGLLNVGRATLWRMLAG